MKASDYCIAIRLANGRQLRVWNPRKADAVAFARSVWLSSRTGSIVGVSVVGERQERQPDGRFRWVSFEPFSAGEPIVW